MIDGQVEQGEWDTFYTLDSVELKATTFADWTDSGLYFAVRANKAVDALILIDANNDGWFHGGDNLQIKALRPGSAGQSLEVFRYDSRSAKIPAPQQVPPEEIEVAVMKATSSPNEYAMELAIPSSLLSGFTPRVGSKVGLRFAIRSGGEDASWIPSVTLGDVEECVLVDTKSAALQPLQIHLQARDSKVSQGEDVAARLFLRNDGPETIEANVFVVGGEGKAAQYLNSEMIRIEGLEPHKLIRHNFKSRIPSSMPEGFWALGAELKAGNNRIGGALASFQVVKPYEVTLDVGQETIAADGKFHRIRVTIRNNTSRSAYGQAKITLPEGWQVAKSLYIRKFHIEREDGTEEIRFEVKPPQITEPTKATISVEVTVGKESVTVSREVAVRPGP